MPWTTCYILQPVIRPPLVHYMNCMHIRGWFSRSIQSKIVLIYQSWWISGIAYVYYDHNTASWKYPHTRIITRVEKLYEKPEYSLSGYINLRSKYSSLRTYLASLLIERLIGSYIRSWQKDLVIFHEWYKWKETKFLSRVEDHPGFPNNACKYLFLP